jgi:hypothetical protein
MAGRGGQGEGVKEGRGGQGEGVWSLVSPGRWRRRGGSGAWGGDRRRRACPAPAPSLANFQNKNSVS